MPLMPKRSKHRKMQKGRNRGMATRGTTVSNGEFGLQAIEAGLITRKPAGTRMGKGKGNTEFWVAAVKPGRVMFEIAGVPEATAREALRLATNKLPVKTKFIMKEEIHEEGENNEN